MAYGTPGIQTHEQWLGLVQPVGLVVAPAVLTKLELFPNQGAAYLSSRQRQLKSLLEERDHSATGQPILVVPSFQLLATELLDWGDSDLIATDALNTVPEVVLSEYGETLRPTHAVPKFEGEGLQALVLDLTQLNEWGREFDEAWNPTGHGWDATPQQRFERLLKETEHPIGILFNGSALRLVHAPRGESSGWLTVPLEPMAEVAGRPMLGALELLLGVDRLFGGSPEQRLPALLTASRKNQNEVSTRLAEQVLEALWELLLGFDEAERVAQDAGRTILGDLAKSEEGQKHLYGGLITVLLRLVFLLYAEDEALMPTDSLYGQHYSVNALADRLRQERFEHQSGMADRRGAWASLLSLFRLVYDGGGADPNYLPARHGELFDPDAYPFLEGRDADSSYADGILTNLPAVSDDVVEKVLSRLLWLADDSKVAQRLSYRSLDVEQIGSVYEGIMGFTVEQATGTSVGITYRPPRQKITITVVVDAEQLLAQSGSKREKWLDEQAGVKLNLPAGVKRDLKTASNLVELCLALDKKLSPHAPLGLQKGSLILQPTAERRRSGSHYTPRALTEPIVVEAFRPWLEHCNHQPTAEQILALKVCDPAMGSGAFLVAVCRFLAGWLVQAWERDGYPDDFRQEWDKDTVARRLVAQRCLYGVDKNPFAVNLAKLSLWLVTLSENQPFTFVDHALKCGDSLVGHSVKEIQAAMSEVQLGFLNEQNQVFAQMGIARRESFGVDNLSDEGYDRKKILLQQQINATEGLRRAGDLMVAAFFNAKQPANRAEQQQIYLGMVSGTFEDDSIEDAVDQIRDQLTSGEKGITPFHWDLEFPEVFNESNEGFDVVIGNPPFLGSVGLSSSNEDSYTSFLRKTFRSARGKTDLCAFFLLRSWEVLKQGGTCSLITSNTISQGDTRRSGLTHIIRQGGIIYSATRRRVWPGIASVVVAIIHLYKHREGISCSLDGKQCGFINQYLIASNITFEPERLCTFRNIAFLGCKPGEKGFVVGDKTGNIPPSEAESHFSRYPGQRYSLRPFMGGEELNNNQFCKPTRQIVYIEDDDASELTETLEFLRSFLSASRCKKTGWHRFSAPAKELMSMRKKSDSCLLLAETSNAFVFGHGEPETIYSNAVWCFIDDRPGFFALLQSLIHEEWSRLLTSTLKEDLRYVASACLETLPLPDTVLTKQLEILEDSYLESRSRLLKHSGYTLRGMSNNFNNPSIKTTEASECRAAWERINNHLLDHLSTGLQVSYGFGLDYIDFLDNADVPLDFQEMIETGSLFFEDPDHAVCFEERANSIGLSKKLAWRYRWPDQLRANVLACLLAMNREQFASEKAMGLHIKETIKQPRKTKSTKPKVSSAQQAGFQLEAEPYQAGLNLGL